MVSKRRSLLLCLLLVTGLLFGWSGRRQVTAQSSTGDLLGLINQFRAGYGLPGYVLNGQLAAAAQSHANWMASTGLYSHTGAGGSSPQSRAAAAGYGGYVVENIVGGTNLSPQQGLTWWINSPVHFNALISNRHSEAGIGFAQGNDQNFYVLVVGNPDGSAGQLAARPATGNAREEGELFVVAPIVLSTPREDGSIIHTVGSGQSLWAIAARYEISLQELLLFNNLKEDSLINPGDELTIRLADGAEPPPTPPPPTTHLVRSGDSAWTIAARYNISLDDFLWLNAMGQDDMLRPGDTVTIRLEEGQAPPPTPTPKMTHVVQSGETLWDISLLYGLSVDQLLDFNQMSQSAVLSIGQEIWIRPEPTPSPTFTPPAPAEPSATPELQSHATATPTPTPPTLLAMASSATQAEQPARQTTAQANQDWTRDWTLGAALGFFILAVFLIGVLIIVVMRRSRLS